MKNKTLIVAGAWKTGTSTMVGILNSHPEILVHYEIFANANKREVYCRKLGEYNKLKGLGRKEFYQTLCDINDTYKFVGDKDPRININIHNDYCDYQVIFTIRDLRTWLAKYFRKQEITDNRIIITAIQYTKFLMYSYLLKDVIHIKMKDMLSPNAVGKMGNFLGIKNFKKNFKDNWPSSVYNSQELPKKVIKYWQGHMSSLVNTGKVDTQVKIKAHSFWDQILPVFDKYFNLDDKPISVEEISKDMTYINNIKTNVILSLEDIYENIKRTSITKEVEKKIKELRPSATSKYTSLPPKPKPKLKTKYRIVVKSRVKGKRNKRGKK